jgi:hypothetical protein
MSPARAPSRSRPPKARVYALSTHDDPVAEKPSVSLMSGSATLTTVMSKMTISCTLTIRPSAMAGR